MSKNRGNCTLHLKEGQVLGTFHPVCSITDGIASDIPATAQVEGMDSLP
jgi:hypothetical protein